MDKLRAQLLAATAMLALNGAAYATDMPVKAPPVAPVAPVTNWTGFYFGAQVGGVAFDPSCSATSSEFSDFLPCSSSPFFQGKGGQTNSMSSTAFIGGAKIGYDWQFWSHAVVGVVGDFDWTNLSGTQQTTFTRDPGFIGATNEKIDWLASVRGRLGWAFDNVLFYATGGVAWTQIKTSASFTFPGSDSIFDWAGQGSSNETGVVAGGGFEYRVSQNLSVVGELLWYDFGITSISASPAGLPALIFTTQFNNNDILVGTLGANWRF